MPLILEEGKIETAEEAKARRNAEYLAMLEESRQQFARGEIVSMTYTEWNNCPNAMCDAVR